MSITGGEGYLMPFAFNKNKNADGTTRNYYVKKLGFKLVDKNKLRYFISAGTAYIRRKTGFRWIRFDILSITLDGLNQPTFFLIEDVYF